jgi:hypothetical protein
VLTRINSFASSAAGTRTGGGGYHFNDLTKNVEALGRLPATTARSYQVGIARQLVAPWASPGETVKAVRDRVEKWFHLKAEDVSYVSRIGEKQPIKVTTESTFVLQLNDTVQFWRNDLDESAYRIGLPVAACGHAPDVILQSDVVQNDQAMPAREDFPDTDLGDRQYQSSLQKWLVGVCFGSIQHNSTSVYARANAWSEVLEAAKIGGNYGESFDPKDGEMELDERFIEPYADHLNGGLKMITIREMKRMRNRVLPTLAYDLNADTYTAGGDFYDRAQAGHLNRFADTRKPLPFKTFGSIPPQILAANDFGLENYAEWDIGDLTDDKARAYYPTGMTWWRLNQTIGQIKRHGGTNYFHLDEDWRYLVGINGGATNKLFWLPYTGNVTSVVAMFLHGRIPMDKEILGAYLIYSPGDAPEFEAIGCQGQYDGNVYIPLALGNSESWYVGHQSCFWMHYHGYTTNHEKDAPYPYHTLRAKNHVELGHPRPRWFNEQGTQDDPSMPDLLGDWADSRIQIVPELQIIDGDLEYQPFVAGGTQNLYTKHIDIIEPSFEDTTHGFAMPAQGYLDTWHWGEDIKQIKTEHEIWKDITYAQYNLLMQRYHVNYRAAVNTTEAVASGEYFGSYFRNYVWPRQQQAVAGWLKMGSYDTSGWFSKFISVEPQAFDNNWANGGEVILQADGSSSGVTGGGSGTRGGGLGGEQAGGVNKVINITNTIRHLYNDRVARFYKAQFGLKYTDLYDTVAAATDTNEAFADRMHQDYEDPWFFNNYRYMYRQGASKWGMWLNDPWHCPPMALGAPIVPGDAGDPLPQASGDRKARITDVTSWDDQGLASTDPNYEQYYPTTLMATDQPLTETLPPYASTNTLVRPIPADPDASHYWRVVDSRLFAHSFTVDLRQMPYELLRRNWRYQAPRVDSTNATCPNVECFVHQNGWTVGQLLENSLAGWGGYGVMPSTSSDRCANCHTPLVGVLFVDGDGVVTVQYDTPMEQDPLISAIEAKTDHVSYFNTLHHGFTVEYFNTIVQQWRTLMTVGYNNVTSKWSYREWDGTDWVVKETSTLPTLFKGVEGANGKPKNFTQAMGSHFVVFAAAKVRFKVSKPIVVDQVDPVGGYTACTPTSASRTISIASLTQPIGKYAGRTIWLRSGSEEREFNINEITGTGPYTVKIGGDFDDTFDEYKIEWKDFITRCTRFRVYGFPYTKKQLVITPPGFVQPIFLYQGVTDVHLNNWPTQIYSVTATVGEAEDVTMFEWRDGDDDDDFVWQVEKDTFDGQDYLRITGGAWYYDYKSNRLVFPDHYVDPVSGDNVSIWSINSSLYGDPNKTFNVKTLPNMVLCEYFVGNGMPIDVPITSYGPGPSYQLEAESVSFIHNHSDDNQTAPAGITSDPMPDMGESVPLKTNNNQRVPLKWQVYNHEPLYWDRSVRWLIGDELKAGAWSDDAVLGVFSGGKGGNTSDLGAGAALGGAVKGTATFYGAPNTILSGQVYVYAKAMTKRTYKTPEGDVTFMERTGGYRSGAFTFRLEVTDNVQSRRTGITCGIPQVLIFLRERYSDSEAAPQMG